MPDERRIIYHPARANVARAGTDRATSHSVPHTAAYWSGGIQRLSHYAGHHPNKRPVSRVVVVPGQKVKRGEPMLYVASPDYSQLRTNYLKARDAGRACAESLMHVRRICINIKPSPSKPWSRLNPLKCRPAAIWRAAQAALKVMGVTDPESLVKAPPSFEVPVKAPIGGEVVEQLR